MGWWLYGETIFMGRIFLIANTGEWINNATSQGWKDEDEGIDEENLDMLSWWLHGTLQHKG